MTGIEVLVIIALAGVCLSLTLIAILARLMGKVTELDNKRLMALEARVAQLERMEQHARDGSYYTRG